MRALALQLANQDDLDRVLWLEAKTAAGLGRLKEALRGYEQVRRALADHERAYDYALATLEEAALLAAQGRNAQVRALAVEALPAFVVRRIHREGLATLKIFVQATESERLTAELALQLVAALKRDRPAA